MDLETKRARIDLFILMICFSLVLFSCCDSAFSAPLHEQKSRILVLHSYGDWYRWTSGMNRGIMNAFRDQDVQAEFFIEYMHGKRFAFRDFFRKYSLFLEKKYRNTKFDLIVSTDDDAFSFLSKNARLLFPDTAIVFCGVNDGSVLQGAELEGAGFIEELAIRETAKSAISLHPEATRIILVSDSTTTGKILRSQALEELAPFEDYMEIEDLHGLDKDSLQDSLNSLNGVPSIIFFLGFYRGSQEEIYSTDEALAMITDASNWPLYSFWDFTLLDKPYSAVGGVVFSGEKIGYEAGIAAADILSGKNEPGELLSLEPGKPELMFSYPAARRHGLEEKNLHEKGRVLFRPESFLDRYWGFIAANMVFFSVMTILLAVLSYVISRRKKVEGELETEKQYWENLFRKSPEAIVITDEKGKLHRVNRAFCELFGFDEVAINGKSLDGLFSRDRKQFEEAVSLTRTLDEKGFIETETRRRNSENKNIDVLLMAVNLSDDRGSRFNFWIYRDITERKKAESELSYRLKIEEVLAQISSRLVFIRDLNLTLDRIKQDIEHLVTCSGIFIAKVDRKEGRLVTVSSTESMNGKARSPWNYDLTLTAWLPVLKEIREKGSFHARKDTTGSELMSRITEQRSLSSLLVLPVNLNNCDERILVFENITISKVSADTDLTFLKTISHLLGETLRKVESNRELEKTASDLKRTFGDALRTISKMLEIKDPYTSGHQARVTELAVAIARELGLDEEAIEAVYYSSLVHDIGKASIPGEILAKPGRLSSVEFELIKHHVEFGWTILKNIDFPWPLAEIVRQHHERLDGSGYPRGLKEDEILPEAMIMTVADVVEAMSSDRPYRPSLGLDRALDEISDHSGEWFSSEAVEACIRLFREKEFKFSEGRDLEELSVKRRG